MVVLLSRNTMNSRGIIRIIEATIAVVIILTALLLLAGQKRAPEKNDLSDKLAPLLDSIAKNENLRKEILSYDTTKDVTYAGNQLIINDLQTEAYKLLENPSYSIVMRVCLLDDLCPLESYPSSGDVYARERVISTSLSSGASVSSLKIKIFLYRKV